MLIPQGPNDLTAEWLTEALQAGGALGATGRVTALRAAPPPGGEGFLGQVVRVELSYDGEAGAAPSSLIAKLSASTRVLRERTAFAHAKEVRFYRELADRVGARTPACYYGEADTATGYHVLLLEDLSPALPVPRADGCSPEQARQAVHAIARMHGRWWESQELVGQAWLRARPLPNAADSVAEYEGWWKAFVAKLGDQLLTRMHEIGESFGPHRLPIEQRLWFTPPLTLKHNDFGPGNILFDPQGGPPAVIDWASTGLGRGTRDIGWFLSECLDPETRRAIDMDLLREYHAILQRFRSIVSTIAVVPFTDDQKQQVIDHSLARNCAAILEHDAGSLLR